MSVQSFGESSGGQPQRLLPEPVNDRLTGWIARVIGIALLLASTAGWLSLVTWSNADPSLTHATSGATRNLLGPLGAVVSDLFMQMLGLAGVLALLPLAFWGLKLATEERLTRLQLKLVLAPIAVLFLAGALSSLPTPKAWPLHHGFGGILGDVTLGLMTSLLGFVNPDRASAAGGLFYVAGGLTLMVPALGLTQKDLARALATGAAPATAGTTLDPMLGLAPVDTQDQAHDNAHDHAKARWRMPGTGLVARLTARQAQAADPDGQDPQALNFGSPPHPAAHDMHAVPREGLQMPRPRYDAPPARHGFDAPLDRGPGFDDSTERTSRTIAERFAPAVDAPHASSSGVEPQSGMLASLAAAAFRRGEAAYKRPSLNMLKRAPAAKAGPEFAQNVLRGNARLLEDVLGDFGVKGEIKDIKPGPVVTLFELEPARGTKSSRVIGLADDIARSMSAMAVRVAVVPGRNVIGIELPNARRETVYLREILEGEAYQTDELKLPLALGKAINGDPVVTDLARMPHLLVAGTTGSGKSVGVNAMILSLLYRLSPDECRFLMIDPKMLELSVYNGIPHLLAPVVTDPQKAVSALNWAVREMEERYKRMSELSVRNIDAFNNRLRQAQKKGEKLSRTVQTGFDRKTGEAIYETQKLDLQPMPYIVIVVDEFADLMVVAGKEIEGAVQRLAQMARAAGIHLIMATQRPSVDIITGTIKANFPTRISFKVTSKIDSRTILNEMGAEQLLGQGDMLFAPGTGQVVRVHGPFVSDEEVESIASHLRGLGAPQYVDGITDTPEQSPIEETGARVSEDDIYDRAVAIVVRDQKASTSYIQRRLSIGYNRAADLIERMERDGVISAPNHAGKRAILVADHGGSDRDRM